MQNKKEELQSRREFFKKAAKAALPVVGAVVMSSLPVQQAQAMGCQLGNCEGYCSGSCYGGCGNGCGGNCMYGCSDSCKNTCTGGCAMSCRGGSYY